MCNTVEFDPAGLHLVIQICLVFEVFGFLFSVFILGLSTIRHKEGFNIGPRIFAANLMLVNIVLTVVTFIRDYGEVNVLFVEFYYSLGGL